MKFAECLTKGLVSEWRSQYIDYKELKNFIEDSYKDAVKDAINSLNAFQKYEEAFLQMCDHERNKVIVFTNEKIAEATRKFYYLKKQATIAKTLQENSDNKIDHKTGVLSTNVKRVTGNIGKNNNVSKSIDDLKYACSEFYLSLIMLKNYQMLNYTGFRKILKKFDKIFNVSLGHEYFLKWIDKNSFYPTKDTDKLITDTENLFIYDLEKGDRSKAMKQLRVPPLSGQTNLVSWPSFEWGFCSGLFSILIIIVILSVIDQSINNKFSFAQAKLYRAPLVIFVYLFLIGINIHFWKVNGVNYVLIFELDPRNHLSSVEIMKMAAFFGCTWCLSILAFMHPTFLISIKAIIHPLSLVIFVVIFMLNPLPIFYYSSRIWLIKHLLRLLITPILKVTFADFWLADQLNSLVIPLRDISYFICYYSFDLRGDVSICSRPTNYYDTLVAVYPATCRFIQCIRRYYDSRSSWPHLFNSIKYFLSILVTLLSFLSSYEKNVSGKDYGISFGLWITFIIMTTFYSLYWDVCVDWGLFNKSAPSDHRFLRDQLIYRKKIFYYLAIITDLFLRFSWTLTLTIGHLDFIHDDLFKLMLALLESLRRFIWNFFRLENEHLNNVGQFRAVRDISIKPIRLVFHENGAIEEVVFDGTSIDHANELELEYLIDSIHGPIGSLRLKRLVSNDLKPNSLTHRTIKTSHPMKFVHTFDNLIPTHSTVKYKHKFAKKLSMFLKQSFDL